MKEYKQLVTENNCYKNGSKRKKTFGVLIHDTATPGAMPENFAKQWNTATPNGRQVCVHAFADDKKVIQILPYEYKCWGCGSGTNGSSNSTHIQIEMCIPKEVYFSNGWVYNTSDLESTTWYIEQLITNTALWCAERLFENNIYEVTKTTVTSHFEQHKVGLASNHSDPSGLFSLVGFTMDNFRDRVKVYLTELINQSTLKNNNLIQNNIKSDSNIKKVDKIDPALNDIKEPEGGYKVQEYRVKVTANSLNIRKGPGIAYDKVKAINDFGVYTIIKTNGHWGKLKSGAGWINLNYTKPVQ